MVITDPSDSLHRAHEHGGRLRDEAAAARLRGPSRTRRACAASLRRVADRLDGTALAPPLRGQLDARR
jgi:hypothetical protein